LVECRTCGKFTLTGTAEALLRNFPPARRVILSAVLRDASLNGQPPLEVDSYSLDALSDPSRVPKTVGERLERIGRLLEQRQDRIGAAVNLMPEDEYPVAFARDGDEFWAMLRILRDRGDITLSSGRLNNAPLAVTLTPKGINWLDRIRVTRRTEGNLVFVAMPYDDPYKDAFEPGVRAACGALGYNAEPLYRDESNAMWMDRILSRIRESRFVVADISEHRGGVYLEAGYALGQNLPVIFTCKDERFGMAERVHAPDAPCVATTERPVAHSDAKNWTVVRWTTTDDLKGKVESRILRTVGRFQPRA